MKKNIYLTVLTIVTVICVIVGSCYHLIGWGVSLAEWFNRSVFHKQTENAGNLMTDTVNLDAFSNITADINVMDFTLTEGSDFSISYSASKKLVPEYEVKNNTLTLKQKDIKGNQFPGTGNKKCTVIITVPDSLQTVQIDANVGDVDLDGISAKSLILDANVGDVDVTDCSFEQVKADASVGDVDFENSSFQSMDISADVGDVSVSADGLSDYRMELSTDIGEVGVNGRSYRKNYAHSGDSDCKLIIDNSTGDIEVSYR